MEAARMGLGPKMLSHGHKTHNIELSRKTTLCTFPWCFLQNHTLSLKPTKPNLFYVRAISDESNTNRPMTEFTPTVLGDHILPVPLGNSEFGAIEHEIESVMKPHVGNMLMSPHSCDKEKIRLIHLLISLAISHYFENEIEEILNKAFVKLEELIVEEDNLETISIMFEVFRLYGHKMSCDAFHRFKCEDGKFKEHIVEDVRGMLQLYQAAHLKATSEDIMDDAICFTSNHLEALAGSTVTPPHLSRHIKNALFIPRYRNMDIVVAKEYMDFYEQEEGHQERLLKFAKLNLKYCGQYYIQELHTLSKWWKELDLAPKLPYFRERVVELYFGVLGTYFEPRYSVGRVVATKICVIMTVVDDTYDAYGTLPEVESFTDCVQRWDLEAIENLPSYMRFLFQNLWNIMKEIEGDMKLRGRSRSVQLVIDEIKSLSRLYLTVAKWSRTGHTPSFEEFMAVGPSLIGMDDFAAYCFIGVEDYDENILCEWYNSKPKILHAVNVISRLRNDIATFEEEMRRGEVVNGPNCYIKQYGVSKEEAVREMEKMIDDHHKILMDEFFNKSSTVPHKILVLVLNMARVVDSYYTVGDGFGHPDQTLKARFTSLFS